MHSFCDIARQTPTPLRVLSPDCPRFVIPEQAFITFGLKKSFTPYFLRFLLAANRPDVY